MKNEVLALQKSLDFVDESGAISSILVPTTVPTILTTLTTISIEPDEKR